ncbi:VENN motif pre-toxin domain-containing protein [Acinetobacter sp.]|uniref:VENN motif pre-toxin domain-containing protein n=1 Tax=Acinetobacter sp. TaxID=472 RepID=UPI0031D819C1
MPAISGEAAVAAASRTYAQDQIKNAAAEKEAIGKQIASQLSPEEQAEIKKMSAVEKDNYLAQNAAYASALANEKAVTQQWGVGGNKGRALNAVTTVITGALGGQTDIQVAANALAPYAAQQIGEKFGHGEDKNKAAQLASHVILGATLAYLNGGNPAAGGGAAVASEAAADYLANQYNDGKTAINPETGKFDANLLPENVKSSIRDLTAAIGAVVGGTVGDSKSNAQLAGVIGQNAVENNYLAKKDVQNLIKDLESTKSETEKAEIYKKYAELSEEKRELAAKACVDISSSACQQAIIDMKDGYNFSQNQNAVLDYKYTLEPEIEWTSGQGPLKLEITKASEDVYKNTQEVRFVEYENLSDLAKYSNSESSEKIEDYLGSKDYKYTNQPVLDKPLGNMYIFPSLQIAGGALTVAGGALLGATTCETGIGCIVAGYGVASGFDDVRTGGLNFGKEPESHNSTLREDALKSLGMSDQAAAWTSLAVDLTSAGGLAKLGANSSGVLDIAEAAQKAKVDLPPINFSQPPLTGSANSVDSAAKSAAQEIITSGENLKQAAAVAVAGDHILGIETKEFTNATLKKMQNYKNLKNEGVIEAIDESTYKITDVNAYMEYLKTAYEASGNVMNSATESQIRSFIDSQKTLSILAGLPGAHAEIQAQNALYNMSNVVRPENATISTYKLGKSNKIDSQGGPFTACTNCSGIIPQETNIPTGRK